MVLTSIPPRPLVVFHSLLQIVMLGVCTSPGKGGGSDPFEELTLQPMPLYTLPSDNTIMTCFAASASGRLFMGANDGHVYEIQYAANDTWRQRRCSKVSVETSESMDVLSASFALALTTSQFIVCCKQGTALYMTMCSTTLALVWCLAGPYHRWHAAITPRVFYTIVWPNSRP